MIVNINNLIQGELTQLREALPLIAILIGKADNNLDLKELDLAKKIAHIRTFSSSDYLKDFYETVEEDFDKTLDMFDKSLPTEVEVRNNMISDRLTLLNPILAQLHPKLGAELYRGFVRYAKEIAKASGGFLGFMAVNPEESKWIDLPMLVTIVHEQEEEE
ncbi:MAG: hypothetical protein ABI761_11710 [Saprospiraceae bacterium]